MFFTKNLKVSRVSSEISIVPKIELQSNFEKVLFPTKLFAKMLSVPKKALHEQ